MAAVDRNAIRDRNERRKAILATHGEIIPDSEVGSFLERLHAIECESSQEADVDALLGATEPIVWTGDLADDCTARWRGLMGRAEKLSDQHWYVGVYRTDMPGGEPGDDTIYHHLDAKVSPHSGTAARRLAEMVMRLVDLGAWTPLPGYPGSDEPYPPDDEP